MHPLLTRADVGNRMTGNTDWGHRSIWLEMNEHRNVEQGMHSVGEKVHEENATEEAGRHDEVGFDLGVLAVSKNQMEKMRTKRMDS